MLDALKKYGAKVVAVAMVSYSLFFYSLGTGTLGQHLYRIANTREARQLVSELYETATDSTYSVVRRFRESSFGEP